MQQQKQKYNNNNQFDVLFQTQFLKKKKGRFLKHLWNIETIRRKNEET